MNECIVISVHHTLRNHRYITLWAPNDCGYRWRLSGAGRYPHDQVMSMLDYYNSGSNITVPAEVVERLARPGDPRDFDGVTIDMPVSELLAVPNNKGIWEQLVANMVAPAKYKPWPDYPGARRRKEAA